MNREPQNNTVLSEEFRSFLENKIELSKEALDLGIRQAHIENAPLAITLWSFGLVNNEQYQEIINWSNDK